MHKRIDTPTPYTPTPYKPIDHADDLIGSTLSSCVLSLDVLLKSLTEAAERLRQINTAIHGPHPPAVDASREVEPEAVSLISKFTAKQHRLTKVLAEVHEEITWIENGL